MDTSDFCQSEVNEQQFLCEVNKHNMMSLVRLTDIEITGYVSQKKGCDKQQSQ
jgi:hypothetical protein